MRRPAVVALVLALSAPLAFAASAAPGAARVQEQRCAPGERAFRLANGQPARVRVTPGTRDGRKRLVVALHGAGGGAANGLGSFRRWSARGLVLVAPSAKGQTWSALRGADVDLESINLALRYVYARCPVDRTRVAVGGFSDGATYALSLGLSNGDLFPAVVAFSPGGILGGRQVGRPRFFVSHGTRDPVLPIQRTSAVIVRELRRAGYSVTYRTFTGGHTVPPDLAKRAERWLLSP